MRNIQIQYIDSVEDNREIKTSNKLNSKENDFYRALATLPYDEKNKEVFSRIADEQNEEILKKL